MIITNPHLLQGESKGGGDMYTRKNLRISDGPRPGAEYLIGQPLLRLAQLDRSASGLGWLKCNADTRVRLKLGERLGLAKMERKEDKAGQASQLSTI